MTDVTLHLKAEGQRACVVCGADLGRRVRRCMACGHRFMTLETVVKALGKLVPAR